MDDLEKAIIFSFDESGGVDPRLKSQAISYCQRMKESPGICRICMEKVLFSSFPQVQFWCLQTVQDILPSLDSDERSLVRNSVVSIAISDDAVGTSAARRVVDWEPCNKNKLAQVFVTLVFYDYPARWSSAFLDFLPNLAKGAAVIDMFCRVLNALDDELVSLDYPRTADEIRVSGNVKDAMRQQCVPQIVRAWYDVIALYKSSDPELAAAVLDTMRRYVSWIDIALIANDVFLRMLFEIVLVDAHPDRLRAASGGCLLAIVSKRMEPIPKIGLLRSLQINRIFGMVIGDVDSELGSSLGSLLVAYATESLECSKRLESEDAYNESVKLLEEVLPSVFYVMRETEEDDTTFTCLQFLSSYVSTMKTFSPLKEKQMLHLGHILEVIRQKIRYDPAYRENLDLPDKIGKEEEERMNDYRKDLFVLLRSIGRIAPDVTQMFIRNSLASVLGSVDSEFEDVEAAISLLYAIGESINDEAIRSGTGVLKGVVPMLLSAKFSFHSHRLVALVYLETVNRFVSFVHEYTQYIPLVLGAFLDERGIHHPNINVNRRASYLFMRVVKALKGNLLPFIETILQSLQDTLVRFTQMDWALKELDGTHIFEAIGMLLGMEDMSPEKQSEYLSLLLVPLCQQVDMLLSNVKADDPAELSAKVACVQQIISAINSLSKGFNERLATASRPTIGVMFKQTLDVLLKVLLVFPKNEQLRTKVTSFIHRMVETLGASIFPYLPRALEQLIVESEPKEMVDFLVLINQLILKFKTAMWSIMEEIFPSIANRVFHVLPKDAFPSGPGSNTEEVRELQELQRTVFTFLHVMTTNDLSSVLLSPSSRGYLDAVIQLLLCNACSHKDILIRKACVQIFVKLIKDWCSKSNGEEKVPGFRTFIIESFATNCCLYSVLDNSFELHDANTLVLLGEIVVAQKVMYENLGDEFLIHFLTRGFSAAHCPQNLAEQYCQKLQSGDIKTLKSFYQSLIENLRCQKNDSLIFR